MPVQKTAVLREDACCASSLGKQNLAWQDGTEAAHTLTAHPCHLELHRPGEKREQRVGKGWWRES